MTYVVPQGWFLGHLLFNNSLLFRSVNQIRKSLPEKQRQNWTSLIRYSFVSTTTISASCCFDPEFLGYLLNMTLFWLDRSWSDRGENCSGCREARVAFMPKHKFYNGFNTCLQPPCCLACFCLQLSTVQQENLLVLAALVRESLSLFS